MTKSDLTKIGIVAVITTISLALPGLLWQRGLPLTWALALVGGFVTVAVLGHVLKFN
jgi:uncharacterized membrane protein